MKSCTENMQSVNVGRPLQAAGEGNMLSRWNKMSFSNRPGSREFSARFCILPLLLILCAVALLSAQERSNAASWKFAVSGDSRNCGDIVMPAIAQGVAHDGAAFYWHLGDYRAIRSEK